MPPDRCLPDQPVRQRKTRPWRLVTLSGGMLLAATFFMPAVRGCNVPIVPAEESRDLVIGLINDPAPSADQIPEAVVGFCMYMAAYLLGGLIALAAAARLARIPRAHRVSSALVAAAILFDCLSLLGLTTITWLIEPSPPGKTIPWLFVFAYVIAPALVFIYMFLTIRLPGRAFLAHVFVASLAALAWFGFWSSSSGALYGVRVSLAAACLMIIGTVGEAARLTEQSLSRTLGQLFLCRLREIPATGGRCPNCDYNLFGLTEQRCPECGRPFTFHELGTTPEELGFRNDDTPTEPRP